ncbi:MAG: hypothetical protein WCL16_11630, partial [bacterium]
MAFPVFNRNALRIRPLGDRENKLRIERDAVDPDAAPAALPPSAAAHTIEVAERILRARRAGRPVVLAFGAHTIKNGLAPVLIRLIERGWVTHLATNGAGIIHDWEFAYQGASSEDVRGNVARGEFGIWEDTGFTINLALAIGAYRGFGYGESIGALIETERLVIPSAEALASEAAAALADDPERAAAAADLLGIVRRFQLTPGERHVPHPFRRYSAQAAAYRLHVPFTGHPMIGHDIIYTHPMNHGGAIGRTALRDFLSFAHSINQLDDGVYLSVGSAVMSPMIFEKALSMAQNLHLQQGAPLVGHFIAVVDLAESSWDWATSGEPPPT